jgi:hypothetical protein
MRALCFLYLYSLISLCDAQKHGDDATAHGCLRVILSRTDNSIFTNQIFKTFAMHSLL